MVHLDEEQHALCFELLANKLRLDILKTLRRQGKVSAGELANMLGAERTRVSHALALLKECRLVTATKEGRSICYSLNNSPIFTQKGDIFSLINEHAKRCTHCTRRG